ncbi:hypothetical protein [Lysobacter soyae]|uniref:Uncharacterized protein n=1 Tax=Lysobacter soyae TaxID=2764185 RepID=A0ABX8WPF4_9GAMM|nr:hypothetical protein [Lysobacter sp. CJ11]QYR52953.1 hypothetical protein H8L67_00025 [Lysobacter sp. CJ11]
MFFEITRVFEMLDFIFVISPFIAAWWLAGWPGKNDPTVVKMAGLSFILFGVSMFLRMAIFGRQMPAGKYTDSLMSTSGTIGFCVFIATVGFLVLFVHHYFSKKD